MSAFLSGYWGMYVVQAFLHSALSAALVGITGGFSGNLHDVARSDASVTPAGALRETEA